MAMLLFGFIGRRAVLPPNDSSSLSFQALMNTSLFVVFACCTINFGSDDPNLYHVYHVNYDRFFQLLFRWPCELDVGLFRKNHAFLVRQLDGGWVGGDDDVTTSR